MYGSSDDDFSAEREIVLVALTVQAQIAIRTEPSHVVVWARGLPAVICGTKKLGAIRVP
jgi:hypothetical protein